MEDAFERFVNVVDVESTCCAGGPPAGESSEIIEIGVCVVDTDDWRRVERPTWTVGSSSQRPVR